MLSFLTPNGLGLVHPTRRARPPNSVFDTGSPNSVSILVRPTGPKFVFFFYVLVRPTGLEGFRIFFKYWFAQRVWRGFGFFLKYWFAQLRFDTGLPNSVSIPRFCMASSRGWGGAEAFGWDRGVSQVSQVSHPLSQDCLSCPNLQLAGAGAGVGKCEDFASFFGSATQRRNWLRGTAVGFLLSFFDTQRVGLGPPNPPGSILFRPTPFLILVRPTPFRYWFAQLGPKFVFFFMYWFAQRVWRGFGFFLSTGSPNGSVGVFLSTGSPNDP